MNLKHRYHLYYHTLWVLPEHTAGTLQASHEYLQKTPENPLWQPELGRNTAKMQSNKQRIDNFQPLPLRCSAGTPGRKSGGGGKLGGVNSCCPTVFPKWPPVTQKLNQWGNGASVHRFFSPTRHSTSPRGNLMSDIHPVTVTAPSNVSLLLSEGGHSSTLVCLPSTSPHILPSLLFWTADER